MLYVCDRAYDALAFARGRHDGLDHAGHADLRDAGIEGLEGVGKDEGRGRQAQGFGGKAADAFAIHGQLRSTGAGNHAPAFRLELDKLVGGDSFDFRHDQRRLFQFDNATQRSTVEHGNDMAAISNLHARRMLVAIHGDDFAAQSLQLNDDFATQLAGAEQHDPCSRGGERGSENRLSHDFCS